MSVKWTRNQNDCGILRKGEFKEKKEDLFVFGYSCKLFRDNEKALHIDQGKHLIPWMGDDSLKIDRYDARGALHNLSALEAPPGGYDWRVELTRNELDVEQLCDEERYRAMHTDEVEEEMYKEEELKRLHAAGYGQVGFNYDPPTEPATATTIEADEDPFIASPALIALLPADVVLPESEKLNAIIEKTAKFISSQGAQMEILLRAKQADNPQFKFLNKESPLHPYYIALIALVKAGKWPEKPPEETVEEKPPETDEYLHPSLSAISVESAPSIPSIPYRPSADCDYTLLVSKMSGAPSPPPAGEEPPPGTAPLPLPCDISRAPVMYNLQGEVPPPPPLYASGGAVPPPPAPPSTIPPAKSTGLSLMKNYDSYSDDSDSDSSSSTDTPKPEVIPTPPEDVRIVIDKMAAYVARNGDEFADIVRAKNDPRFTFLEPNNMYHGWYLKLMKFKRGVANGEKERKPIAPVSFSIKKLKEPEPVLLKPALPYESSSDEEDKPETNTTDNGSGTNTPTTAKIPQIPLNVPPVTVYKIDAPIKPLVVEKRIEPLVSKKNEIKIVEASPVESKTLEVKPVDVKPQVVEAKVIPVEKTVSKNKEKQETDIVIPKIKDVVPKDVVRKEKSKTPEKKQEVRVREEKRDKYKEKRDYPRSQSRDVRSVESEKRRHKKEREKRRKKCREEMESEIISLEENDELIDLTEDYPDTKEGDTEAERAKQVERRRRAAEFLKKVGVDPAAALPASSLASAMVDTLESIRKKKAEEEAKRRKKEKRKRRYEYNGDRDAERSHKKKKRRKYDDETDESDHDSSKRKRRKKDKKTTRKQKKRKEETDDEMELINDPPLNIDLTSTLKELRYASPSKELCFQDLEDQRVSDSSAEAEKEIVTRSKKEREYSEGEVTKSKKEREYSEGEWSSDSEADSESTAEKNSE